MKQKVFYCLRQSLCLSQHCCVLEINCALASVTLCEQLPGAVIEVYPLTTPAQIDWTGILEMLLIALAWKCLQRSLELTKQCIYNRSALVLTGTVTGGLL